MKRPSRKRRKTRTKKRGGAEPEPEPDEGKPPAEYKIDKQQLLTRKLYDFYKTKIYKCRKLPTIPKNKSHRKSKTGDVRYFKLEHVDFNKTFALNYYKTRECKKVQNRFTFEIESVNIESDRLVIIGASGGVMGNEEATEDVKLILMNENIDTLDYDIDTYQSLVDTLYLLKCDRIYLVANKNNQSETRQLDSISRTENPQSARNQIDATKRLLLSEVGRRDEDEWKGPFKLLKKENDYHSKDTMRTYYLASGGIYRYKLRYFEIPSPGTRSQGINDLPYTQVLFRHNSSIEGMLLNPLNTVVSVTIKGIKKKKEAGKSVIESMADFRLMNDAIDVHGTIRNEESEFQKFLVDFRTIRENQNKRVEAVNQAAVEAGVAVEAAAREYHGVYTDAAEAERLRREAERLRRGTAGTAGTAEATKPAQPAGSKGTTVE